jgi:hypothetical protein
MTSRHKIEVPRAAAFLTSLRVLDAQFSTMFLGMEVEYSIMIGA